MTDDTMKARVFRGYNFQGVELHLRKKHRPGVLTFGEPVAFGEYVPPTACLDLDEAQALMDSLWQAGIRPIEAKAGVGAFDAQARHLADMRAIAFDRLKVLAP